MADHGTDWCNGVETRLAEAEATIAEQAATIERFREHVRWHDRVESFDGDVPSEFLVRDYSIGDYYFGHLVGERNAARAAITASDMGQTE